MPKWVEFVLPIRRFFAYFSNLSNFLLFSRELIFAVQKTQTESPRLIQAKHLSAPALFRSHTWRMDNTTFALICDTADNYNLFNTNSQNMQLNIESLDNYKLWCLITHFSTFLFKKKTCQVVKSLFSKLPY